MKNVEPREGCYGTLSSFGYILYKLGVVLESMGFLFLVACKTAILVYTSIVIRYITGPSHLPHPCILLLKVYKDLHHFSSLLHLIHCECIRVFAISLHSSILPMGNV